MLVHADDVVPDALTALPSADNRLGCGRCGGSLGETWREEAHAWKDTLGIGDGADAGTSAGSPQGYRLFKDRVTGRSERDPLAQYQLFTRLVTTLVAAAEARGQFRFLVVAQDNKHAPRMQLSLMNWDTSLQTNHPSVSKSKLDAATRRPVAKVRFCEYGLCPTREDEEYVRSRLACCPSHRRQVTNVMCAARFMTVWADQNGAIALPLLEEEFAEVRTASPLALGTSCACGWCLMCSPCTPAPRRRLSSCYGPLTPCCLQAANS